MRLSPAAEFAIRGALVLAEHHGRGPTTLSAICTEKKLSRQYLAKIFSLLARADIVSPVRGKHGGYVLARDPSQISVLDVIEAVEGPLALNYCQHDPPKCEDHDCPLRAMWTEIQQFARDKLGSMTLDRCVALCRDDQQ